MSSTNGKRTIVIGDLHGCYDELIELLSRIGFAESDRVIAVGDLAVKGPKNKEVLDLFISDDRFSSVLGNHDVSLLGLLRHERRRSTEAQRAAVRELASEREKYCSYLGSLPLLIDLGTHVVIHAGLRPQVPLDRQDADDLLELRTIGTKKRTSRKGLPWYEFYDGEKIALFGHWPAEEPRRGPRAIGLDTGCVYGRQLTAYIVETGELVSVNSRFSYRRSGWRFYRSLFKSLVDFAARFWPGR